MRLEISRGGAAAILWEAAANPAHEVCGLLLGESGRVSHVVPCRNVASEPHVTFEIDPAALIEAHRSARRGKRDVIGCYHSHPSGALMPSLRDGESAEQGAIWIIVANGMMTCWHMTGRGQFAGGFEPINRHELPDGCTKVAPSPEGRNPYASYESHI